MSENLFEDPAALEALRREAAALLGPAAAARLLYARGFAEGARAALQRAAEFSRMDLLPSHDAACVRPLILLPRPHARRAHTPSLYGNRRSAEALAPLGDPNPASGPSCFATAGYSSGWYSAWLGRPVLLEESECASAGAPACRFEPSSSDEAAIGRGGRLAEDLDVAAILRWAEAEAALSEPDEERADLATEAGPGSSSPIVHLWGPVMVLPYAGAVDGEIALQEIEADLGPGQVDVVVIDLTGAAADGIEAAGIARLISDFEAADLDVILAGLSPRCERALREYGVELPPLLPDLGTALTIALQFSRAAQRDH